MITPKLGRYYRVKDNYYVPRFSGMVGRCVVEKGATGELFGLDFGLEVVGETYPFRGYDKPTCKYIVIADVIEDRKETLKRYFDAV